MQGEDESKECRELLYVSREFQDLVLEFRLREVCNIQRDHDRVRRAQPPARRRARDSAVRGDGQVLGASDEIPKPVVVALLGAGRSRHGKRIIRRPGTPAQLLDTMGSVRRRVRQLAQQSAKCPCGQLRWSGTQPMGVKRRHRWRGLVHEYERAA